MKNVNRNEKQEHIEVWDGGTYQTGSITPPKAANPLMAVLLMLVIFLGGIASAMGLLNLRLLLALQEAQAEPTAPLLQQSGIHTAQVDPMEDALPDAPQNSAGMMLTDRPEERIMDAQYLATVNSACVTVSGSDGRTGTGLVLTQDGYILTYAQLVRQQEQIHVTVALDKTYRATVVGADPITDLAVLYIRANGLTAAPFSDNSSLAQDGYRVWARQNGTLHTGAICPEDVDISLGKETITLLQTSAAENSSFGSVWNTDCQIVGILSPCMAEYFNDESDDLAWVIPSGMVKNIVDAIMEQGFVSGRPSLQIEAEEVSDLYRNYWQLPEGLRICSTENPLLKTGDLILSVGGQTVSSLNQLNELLFHAQPGDTWDVAVLRNDAVLHLYISITEE